MYNLRYHIASLVSVFLALSLGLVLGGLIVQRGTFDRQGASLVEGLQKEFVQLRDQNRDLVAENRQLAALSSDFIDLWVHGKLEGRAVMVVSSAGRNDGLAAAREAIQDAGGEVLVATFASPRFGLDDEALRARIESLAPEPERAEASIAAALAAEWTNPGEERPLTAALVESGVLNVEGMDAETAVSAVVDIASIDGQPDPGAMALAREMRGRLVAAVGAETPKSETGVAAAAAASGLAALDTLGTEVGRYSLVALLSGAEPGYYGVAQAAEGPYPAVALP